jgi:hypothetical protein
LTVIYSAQSEAPPIKSRGALFPLLVVLFVISYAILTLLVVEQGRTIEAQRSLLREMLKDSSQLAALKNKIAREASARSQEDKAQPGDNDAPTAKSGNSGNSVPKAPSKDPKGRGKSARTLREVPEKPAADLQDVRRSTRVI